ncbi:MAG: hypothetical protein ABFS10_08095 [Bacteroidota bacterium]
MHLRRFSLLLIAIFSSITLYSQFNTYSPYTRFGLGDLSKNGFGQNLAMGGTGVAIHEGNRINYLNPAASAALDSTSVYFDFGANAFFNQYKFNDPSGQGAGDISNSWWNMNFHHVAFASSMGKYLGLHAGIVPYSSIGYNIKQEYNDLTSGTALDTYYSGEGGTMNFFLGTSVKFFDRISMGVTMNYLMGKMTRRRNVEFPMNPTIYSSTASREDFDLKQPVFSFGLQYKEVIGDKFFFSLGGVYDLKTDASVEMKYNVTNTIYPGRPIEIDSVTTITPEYILSADTLDRSFNLPQKVGVGIALGIPDKLTVTGDYYMQDWTGALSGPGYKTTNASSLHVGAEYTPDVEALRGYHKFITYRLGGFYSNSYLSVLKPTPEPGATDNYYQLTDYGMTFGVGLPVRSLKSSINVAFTLGTRGTTAYNLVEENYGIVTFNVTLHDLWFRKRRFD